MVKFIAVGLNRIRTKDIHEEGSENPFEKGHLFNVERRQVMLSGKDKKIFTLFSTRIRERFPSARIWAYGSRVKGHATEESDLDVCVVVDTLDDAIDQAIMKIAWEIGFENDMVISTVTYSKQEFDEGPCSESPLVHNILDAGVAA